MKLIRSLVLILMLSSCGSMYVRDQLYLSSEEFVPIANLYIKYKLKYLNTQEIKYPIFVEFGDLPGLVRGTCTFSKNRQLKRVIVIDKKFWNHASEETRIKLFFHEMGHCDLNYGHQDVELGIMNTIINYRPLTEFDIMEFFLGGK